jgi:fumarylacetoacetate (FAA) hydrolase
MLESIQLGKPVTPFLSFGDCVRIEMLDHQGNSIFGAIEQTVQSLELISQAGRRLS